MNHVALRRRDLALVAAVALATSPFLAASARAGSSTITVHTTRMTGLGTILVSAGGRTLYHSSAEPRNVVKCTGACAADWPPFLVAKGTKPVAGAGVRPSLLGTVRRPDGRLQVTYAGMPLYLYSGDKKPGSAAGEGVAGVAWLGGVWDAVSPSGTAVKTAGAPAPTVPAAPSGGTSTTSGTPGMNCYA